MSGKWSQKEVIEDRLDARMQVVSELIEERYRVKGIEERQQMKLTVCAQCATCGKIRLEDEGYVVIQKFIDEPNKLSVETEIICKECDEVGKLEDFLDDDYIVVSEEQN